MLVGCAGFDDGRYGPRDRQFLLGLSGSYSYEDDDNGKSERLVTQSELGYFLSRAHEVGANLGMLYTNSEIATDDAYTILIGPYYNYNYYLAPRTSVFAGPHVGLTVFDDGATQDNEISYGVHVGVRHWLTPQLSFVVQPRYTHADFERELGGEQDRLDVLFGFAFSF
ncbi:MAG: outer membrane beta-barrel protein [Planctomycetota bacterium]